MHSWCVCLYRESYFADINKLLSISDKLDRFMLITIYDEFNMILLYWRVFIFVILFSKLNSLMITWYQHKELKWFRYFNAYEDIIWQVMSDWATALKSEEKNEF